MTCRLPQTPATPRVAAEHYFDDVFTTTGRPKKPHHLRRSSTSRSIGYRSDWGESTNGEEGDEEAVSSPANRRSSVGYLDEESLKQKALVQDRMHHYVSGQLARHKNGHTHLEKDEFITTMDGASEGHSNGENGENGESSHRDRGDYFEQDPYFSR